ncbi:hypothetical protein BC628DRAFT_1364047, partial [Trametes gibbosa]
GQMEKRVGRENVVRFNLDNETDRTPRPTAAEGVSCAALVPSGHSAVRVRLADSESPRTSHLDGRAPPFAPAIILLPPATLSRASDFICQRQMPHPTPAQHAHRPAFPGGGGGGGADGHGHGHNNATQLENVLVVPAPSLYGPQSACCCQHSPKVGPRSAACRPFLSLSLSSAPVLHPP